MIVLAVFVLLFALVRTLVRSPWGRVLRAIREDEVTAQACGKDVFRFKLQAFVLGAIIMAIGGALYAFNIRAISPIAFTPLLGTFIIWAMLVVGGSGRLYGPIAGALVVWAIWSGSQFTPNALALLPDALGDPVLAALERVGLANVRYFAIGALVVLVLLYAPDGITPALERRPPPPWNRAAKRRTRVMPQGATRVRKPWRLKSYSLITRSLTISPPSIFQISMAPLTSPLASRSTGPLAPW